MRRFTYWAALCCISMLLSVSNLFADTHFNLPKNSKGDKWTLDVVRAKLDGVDLVAGDEIAIFNGSTQQIIGHFILNGVCDQTHPGINLLVCSGEFEGNVVGFTGGESYVIKCWDASTGREYSNPMITWFRGWGTKYESDVLPAPSKYENSKAFLDFYSVRPGTIKGIVYKNDGETILPEANIKLDNGEGAIYETVTDENGAYSQVVMPSTYAVTATYRNTYAPTSVTSPRVGSNNTKTVNITMDLVPGSISGLVKDSENQPVENVTISAVGDGVTYEAVTDEDGNYKIETVKIGKYTLSHSHVDGFKDIVYTDVEVESNRNKYVEFRLTDSGAPVKGIVVNNGTGKKGIKVTIGDQVVTTTNGGVFSFEDVALGKYTVKLENANYYTEEYELEVVAKGEEVDMGNLSIYPHRWVDVDGNPMAPVWTIYFKKINGDFYDLPAGTELAVFRSGKILGVHRFEKPVSSYDWQNNPIVVYSNVNGDINEWDTDGDKIAEDVYFRVSLKGSRSIYTLNKNGTLVIDENASTFNPQDVVEGKLKFPVDSKTGKAKDGLSTTIESINFDVPEGKLTVNIADSIAKNSIRDSIFVKLFQGGEELEELRLYNKVGSERKKYIVEFEDLGQGEYEVEVSGYFYNKFYARKVNLNIAEDKEINIKISKVENDTIKYEMKKGYQLFSSIVGNDIKIRKILENGGVDLDSKISFARNEGATSLQKVDDVWNNGFNVSSKRGYLFKNKNSYSFSVIGIPYPHNYPVSVYKSRTNLVSYLPQGTLDAKTAFGSILDSVKFVRNDEGKSLLKIDGRWINNIGTCSPGEAFVVVLNNDVEKNQILVYPSNGTKSAFIEEQTPVHFNCEGGDATNPVCQLYVETAGLEAGDEIAAYCNGLIVGSTVINDPSSAIDNNISVFSAFTDDRAGYSIGEPIVIRAYDASEGKEVAISNIEVIQASGELSHNELVYPAGDNKFTKVKISTGATGILDDLEASLMVYPNPATTELNINAAVPAKTVELFNSLGQCVYSVAPESEQVVIDVDGLTQGVYLLRLNYNDGIIVRKVSVK